jgi:steroid 5-alpha reductase family enzyme
VKLRDVSIVDSVWSLLVFVPAAVAAAVLDGGPRTAVVLGLSGLWALRLAAYITWRHWGEPEDRRYQAIRARNQPRFELKSLYLVFGLQALLGAIVALPLQAAVASTAPWQPLDVLGLAVFAAGFAFETVADGQLARFKADPAQRGRVLDRGLWRFSRHPNYFGECCVWWGLWLVALAAGAWWTVVSPLLMTLLLLKVSGVTLLEKDIGERRPDYTDYVARTNAFVPGRPRT